MYGAEMYKKGMCGAGNGDIVGAGETYRELLVTDDGIRGEQRLNMCMRQVFLHYRCRFSSIYNDGETIRMVFTSYKLAIGQFRTARHPIDRVAKHYVRLLKFGDSLHRYKRFKRIWLTYNSTVTMNARSAR